MLDDPSGREDVTVVVNVVKSNVCIRNRVRVAKHASICVEKSLEHLALGVGNPAVFVDTDHALDLAPRDDHAKHFFNGV